MSWHQVTILDPNASTQDTSADIFLNAVSKAIRENGSLSELKEAEVYQTDSSKVTGHTFYVSPKASAIVKNVLKDFSAVACAEPNLSELRKMLPWGLPDEIALIR